MKMQKTRVLAAMGLMMLIGAGCADSPTLIPSSDHDLRRSNAQFAADAAKRTYPTTATAGGQAAAQADVDYGWTNRIQMINLTDEDWIDADLWVNQTYVVHLSKWYKKQMKTITFSMLFDRDGNTFPTNNTKVRIDKLEVVRDGKIYNVPLKLAD